jgi:hypothetical protein
VFFFFSNLSFKKMFFTNHFFVILIIDNENFQEKIPQKRKTQKVNNTFSLKNHFHCINILSK